MMLTHGEIEQRLNTLYIVTEGIRRAAHNSDRPLTELERAEIRDYEEEHERLSRLDLVIGHALVNGRPRRTPPPQ